MEYQSPIAFKPLTSQRARHKVYHGGRGGGKSRAFARALIYLSRKATIRSLCAREVQLSIKDSVKRLLDDEITRVGAGSEFENTRSEIRHKKTGSLILFTGLRTSDADKIKSLEGIDICWLEEAHTISQQSLDILLPTIRKEQSEIWWSFNPKMKTDPVYQLFLDGDTPPNTIVTQVNYDSNPWFPDVLREQMEWDRGRDPDKFRHVWLGEPVLHSEAQVFYGKWKIAPVPEPPEGTAMYFGADWGFSQDPTTIIKSWIEGRTLYVCNEAGGVGVEIDETPYLFDSVPGVREWKIRADSARPETISYMAKRGFNIEGAKKGQGSVEDGIAHLKGYDIVIDPRCKNTIDEFSLYSYKIDPKSGDILPIIVDKNNHYIDALRYAIEGVMKPSFFHIG